MQQIVEGELKKGLKQEDAADTVRLVLHDAGTYDIKTGTGGLNGSIRFRCVHQATAWYMDASPESATFLK